MQRFRKFVIRYLLITISSLLAFSTSYATQELISLFPLKNYDQTISTWINPNDPDFDKPLLMSEMQSKRFEIFYDHYFGAFSPWNVEYVNKILQRSAPDDIKSIEQTLIQQFSNEGKTSDKIGYGENFNPYTKDWIDGIANNINFSEFDGLTYQTNNRGIAIDNLYVRVLPTDDVHFYDYKIAGQGYPFDNLQMSALWVGTPVYIVAETKDRAWMLVLTPDFIGWVKSNGIARTDSAFINTWTKVAKNKLIAITRNKTSVQNDKGKFLFLAYVGSVFPGEMNTNGMQILVPVADTDQNAIIKHVTISEQNASVMPLVITPHQIANIMKTMIGRPYGWGNSYFYNDCSAELKSLFTPFGIWLPRHSSDQIKVGKMVDMTSATAEQRLAYLIGKGQRFLTLIYTGGHILLYIGNYANPNNNASIMAMTYQNMWGLSPNPPIRRAVIGKSVLLPMLLQFPEDTSLMSQANKKYFQVSYLNQMPDNDIRSLIYTTALYNRDET